MTAPGETLSEVPAPAGTGRRWNPIPALAGAFLGAFGLATCTESSDPCDGVGCGGHGTCRVDGDQVSCECDEGYVWLADPASALCGNRECDLVCVSAELPGIPCVLEECQAWCRRRWDTPDGHCVVGFCSCLAPCDALACQDDCELQGFLIGVCSPSEGCECS